MLILEAFVFSKSLVYYNLVYAQLIRAGVTGYYQYKNDKWDSLKYFWGSFVLIIVRLFLR